MRFAVAEPGGNPVERVGEASASQPDEEYAEHKRNERSGDRNAELGAGPRKRALELGYATEEPEVDAFDFHTLSPGLKRVPELVQQERGEEEESRRDGQREVLAVREAGILGREDSGGERPDDEREND